MRRLAGVRQPRQLNARLRARLGMSLNLPSTHTEPRPLGSGGYHCSRRHVSKRSVHWLPILLTTLLLTPACRIHKKGPHAQAGQPAEDDGQLVTVINMNDPRAAIQLTRGFHGLENNSWRWTMKNFSATLRPPAHASKNGATLQLKFTIPEVMFTRVGPMTVDARIKDADLGPQTYSIAGDYLYIRDVPATALSAEAVNIDFQVDKGLPPGDQETRELAIIVTTVGLLPK
jgi:hypothetical protein